MTQPVADIYKQDQLAGHFARTEQSTLFTYSADYLDSGLPPVATTLPLREEPYETLAGALPPFFTGLLPEGRRLTALRNSLKASRDDELTLLLGVGEDTVGDVRVLPHHSPLKEAEHIALEISDLDFSETTFENLLASNGFADQAALPGVQEKVSGKMLTVPLRNSHDFYMLKLNPPEYPHVVENESFFLEYARKLKPRNSVVESQLVHDAKGQSGLLIRRFDRGIDSSGKLTRLAAEDACQLLDRYPSDKYNLTSLEVGNAVSSCVQNRVLAAQEVVRQFAFAWLIGNGDLHAKNLSVISADSRKWRLSPIYDVPSTAPYGDRTMALSLLGKKQGISRKTFVDFGEALSVKDAAVHRVLDRLLLETEGMLEGIPDLPFDSHRLKNLSKVLKDRRRSLQG